MKEVNLASIISAYDTFDKEELFNNYLSFFGVSLKEQEKKDLKSFFDRIRTSLKVLEGYYLGFTIPQISKEFDILRIGKESVINVELKNEFTTEEKIKKQLKQNKYYLSFLGKDTFHFTYVAKENKLYKLEKEDLVLTSFQELSKLLSVQEVEEIENLERLFDPSNYLVSPFNSTDRFVKKEYFLTKQQEDIKNKIINPEDSKDEQLFFTIKGGAGTGKTLLVYDIARELTEKGEKVLVIHCGNLNKGQQELNEKKILNIVSIRDIDVPNEALDEKGFNFDEYSIVMLDEAQRVKLKQIEHITKSIFEAKKKCIFSLDPKQCLEKSEVSNNIEKYIKNRVSVIENQLTDTIRTSEEILTFVKSILHNKKDFKKILYRNISLKYFTSLNLVTSYLEILRDKKVWKIINYTSSRYEKEFEYDIPEESTSHKIIGQEFDNVVVVIDDSFYYDDKNKLSVKKEKESYYDKFGMLYQNITRARKKLNVVIVNNQEVLSRCLEVLNSKG
ncbi:DNA/RNA helicase domain-containing protein [Capnocytophaga sp. oral taxon 324]|uniref:DNA/RNA helicase domain-containing protein n=1 Tax=Capnocytophaga sp. oral taxon 324 TaxID=712211 RepID=UPI0002A3A451|nr:DNA/RNA helicase domain-containing protein [Capnocytophaga sp. oral taxon 324]EKY18026.1 putative phage head-tail adaptor [Capnocytophaga sp. oral taxon 324 str. F0483]